MPQMAPYNWLILFYLFNMIIMFIITFNHFKHPLNSPDLNKKFFYMKNFPWMW